MEEEARCRSAEIAYPGDAISEIDIARLEVAVDLAVGMGIF